MMRIYLMLALLAVSSSAFADESKQPSTQAQIPTVVTEAAQLLFKEQSFKMAPSPIDGFYNVFTDVDCGYCAKFHQEILLEVQVFIEQQ